MGENKEVYAQINTIIQHILKKLRNEEILQKIKSIILTGSLTTGEIAYIKNKEKLEIYSDFDLIIVLSKINHLRYRKKLRELSTRITRELNLRGILKSHICLVPMTPRFLVNMRPTINNYSIKKTAKTIYGKNYLHLIPDFEAKDIIKEDALEMISNRMAEQLIYRNTEYCGYQSVKAVYDCAGALLVMRNKYTIKYKDKIKDESFYRCKVNPVLNKQKSSKLWSEANRLLIQTFEKILQELFGSEREYLQNHSLLNFILFLMHRPYIKLIKYYQHPKLRINLALYYYLKYIETKKMVFLRKAKKYIFNTDTINLWPALINIWKLCSSTRIKTF